MASTYALALAEVIVAFYFIGSTEGRLLDKFGFNSHTSYFPERILSHKKGLNII